MPSEIEAAALSAFRGYLTETTEEDDGSNKLSHCSGIGRNGEQLSNVPMCRPYGFDSRPKQDTELVFLETQAGLIVCCERYRRPAITDGQVIIYDEQGNRILLKNTSSSRRIEIGKGGTVKDAARKGDSVDAVANFDSWAANVQADLNAINVVLLAKEDGVGAQAVISANWGAGGQLGDISSGSTSVGIED
jgi:phage gp45-like